ncbi:hypothetical protein HanPI659440_Chr13g0485541 [Helianthus annuus]|nr:hypothetical protein HanPI659440_Chr13g0485541 [Helianthus annuus]
MSSWNLFTTQTSSSLPPPPPPHPCHHRHHLHLRHPCSATTSTPPPPPPMANKTPQIPKSICYQNTIIVIICGKRLAGEGDGGGGDRL